MDHPTIRPLFCLSACRAGTRCTPSSCLSACRGGRGCTPRTCFSACRGGRGCSPRSDVSACRVGRGYTPCTGRSTERACTASSPSLPVSHRVSRASTCERTHEERSVALRTFSFRENFWNLIFVCSASRQNQPRLSVLRARSFPRRRLGCDGRGTLRSVPPNLAPRPSDPAPDSGKPQIHRGVGSGVECFFTRNLVLCRPVRVVLAFVLLETKHGTSG